MDASQLKNLNVAVVGGGYAGTAAAKAISNLGAKVTVFEQAEQIGEVGAGIGLRPSSMAAFEEWGILDAITAVTTPSPEFDILSPTGEVMSATPWPEIDEFGFTTHLIHRRDFIDALVSVLPEGMVKLSHKLTGVTDNGSSATVTFENGHSATYDLVIGGDGIRSQVRASLFGDYPPVFAHEHTYRAVIPIESLNGLVNDDIFRMYIDPESITKIYLLPLRHRGQVSFDLSYPSDDPTWSPAISNELLVKVLDGFEPRIIDVVKNIDVSTVNTRAAHDVDPVQTWNSGSVALVGDAAHAMLYHQGQGANSAILDALELGRSLASAASVPEALADYAAKRKPVAQELQRLSRQSWTADSLDDAFPGQKPGEIASTARV